MKNAFVAIFLLTILSSMSARTWAQLTPLSEQDRQEIQNYKLTESRANDLIAAMTEMTQYLASRPDVAEVMQRAMKSTKSEQAANMEKDPKAMAIASRHGLSAREYVYGVPALRMALMSAQGLSGPKIIASPDNVAFAKAHPELKPKMDAADGAMARH